MGHQVKRHCPVAIGLAVSDQVGERTILDYSVVRVADQGAKAAKAGGGKLILVAPTHEVKRLLFTAASTC
jgi:hypothetical protein